MKAQIVNTDAVPNCQGHESREEHRKQWQKVRGMVIKIGAPVEPTGAWKCGTTEVFPIEDAEYRKLVGARPNTQLFICQHAIERLLTEAQ